MDINVNAIRVQGSDLTVSPNPWGIAVESVLSRKKIFVSVLTEYNSRQETNKKT